MTKFVGRLCEVGVGKEASHGAGASATFWIPKTVISFDDKVNRALVSGSYGYITDAAMTAEVVSQWAEGNIEGEINASSFGLFLLALLGTDTPGTITDTTYTHTYTLLNSVTHTSLSLHIKDPIDSMAFRMAMINSLTIDCSLGQFVTFAANFISKTHQDEATQTPTYAIDQRFTSKGLMFKVAADTGALAAATAVSLKKLTLEIQKEVEKIDVLGTLEPEDIVNKTIRISGKLELTYEDRTWRDYMLNGTAKAMEIKFTGSKLLGTTTYPSLDFVFPKVAFSSWEPARGLGDIASQSINFEVMFDLANTRLWSTIALVNKTASY